MKMINTASSGQVQMFNPSRRGFLKLAGSIAGAGALFASCKTTNGPTNYYLGSGDVALLNFIYVLQQVEAAFYTQAVSTPYYNLTELESLCLTDVRDQEIAHMGFLKSILGHSAVSDITPDFSSVTFADRTSVLQSAATIEDIVISGINGAAALFASTTYPIAFSKMISVEARHSAYFRDILSQGTLSDSTVTDSNGLGQAQSPHTVLSNAGKYLHTQFDSSNLPN